MTIDISPVKNPAVAWDLTVNVSGGGNEKISSVKVVIGGFPEPTENIDPPVNSWKKVYRQKGQYPGENTAVVTVTSDIGNQTSASNSWS